MNINEVISELEKFPVDVLTLNNPAEKNEILAFEAKYQLILPLDYKILLTKYNGIDLMGINIYGIKEDSGSYSLEDCYLFEHYEVDNEMPLHLIPFSPDGFGNHYCFDSSSHDDNSCRIVFWQHDCRYLGDDLPEITNNNLADWIKKVMIEWTLEDYNYDGTEK